MRRILGLLAVALAAGIVATGCDAPLSPYAAKVDGVTITTDSLQSALLAVKHNTAYTCGSIQAKGVGEQTYDSGVSSAVLTNLVERVILNRAVAGLGLSAESFVSSVVRAQVEQQVGPSTSRPSCTTAGAQVLADFPASYRNGLLGLQKDEDLLVLHGAGLAMTRASLEAYAQAHRSALSEDCTYVIVVATKTQAQALAADVRAGGKFTTLAKSNSLDSTTASHGGLLGCIVPTALIASLAKVVAALPVAKVSAPVSFDNAWLLFYVGSRTLPPLTQLAVSVTDQLSTTYLSPALRRAVQDASVQVDPSFGSWQSTATGFSVVAPKAPPTPYVLNPGAVVATTTTVATPAVTGPTGG